MLTKEDLDRLDALRLAATKPPLKYEPDARWDGYAHISYRGGLVVADIAPEDARYFAELANAAEELIQLARRGLVCRLCGDSGKVNGCVMCGKVWKDDG